MNHQNNLSPMEKQPIIIYQSIPSSPGEPRTHRILEALGTAVCFLVIIGVILTITFLLYLYCSNHLGEKSNHCPICEKPLTEGEAHNHCPECKKLLTEGEKCPDCNKEKTVEESGEDTAKTETKPEKKPEPKPAPVPVPIASGANFSLTISSYILPAPSVEIRPWFKMYGYNSNIQSKTPFFSKSTYTGRLQDAFPVKSSYAVQLTEGSTYLWFVDNLKGKNSDLVTPTTANGVSTNSIIVKQKKFGLKPFWVTISPGNQIAMKYLRREGNIWHFQLTHYKITNPNYTYHLTFSLETDKVRRTIGTQTSRTHAKATSMNPIVLTNNPSGKSTLDISLDSPDHGHSNIKFTISPTEIARTLNQKMKENPSQNSWIIPIKNEEYTVILCYHVIKK